MVILNEQGRAGYLMCFQFFMRIVIGDLLLIFLIPQLLHNKMDELSKGCYVVICFSNFLIPWFLHNLEPSSQGIEKVVICFKIFNTLVLTQLISAIVVGPWVVFCFQNFNTLVLTQQVVCKLMGWFRCDLLSNFKLPQFLHSALNCSNGVIWL